MSDSVKYETVAEEYIEIIWKLLRNNPVTRVKDIASARGVTLPTASTAVDKLKELGLVEHESYGYVTLTGEGERLATHLEETHNAIKELLEKILNVPENIAEDDACTLEHHISGYTINAMKNFIQFLNNCKYLKTDWLEILQNCGYFSQKADACRECDFSPEAN